MRWRRGEGTDQIEDRRGMGPVPVVGGGLGVVVLLLSLLFGGDILGGGGGSPLGAPSGAPDPNDEAAQFVAFVMSDVQDAWTKTFAAENRTYAPTRLVLFTQSTSSGCGIASASTGPFYCPPDERVYLDLGFFQELRDRFGAPGDFAEAYVIAHEVGHHVQHLLGTEQQVRDAQQSRPDQANALSVRLELQADCYAGLWAHTAYQQNELEPGDVEEGLQAAAAVGDDRIQASAGQDVSPETFTHGSSEQRTRWFNRGYTEGSRAACDTFAAGA
jgi:predicted metalloprotease